jgi:hypothetical protein
LRSDACQHSLSGYQVLRPCTSSAAGGH